LLSDSFGEKEVGNFLGKELLGIITPERLRIPAGVVVYEFDEADDMASCLAFVPKVEHSHIAGEVVYENKVILISPYRDVVNDAGV
jgi:hypothetical protein